MYTYVYIHTYMYICTYMCRYMYLYNYLSTDTCMYMYIYVHIHVGIYEGKILTSWDHPQGGKNENMLYITCPPQNRVLSMS